MSTTIPRTASTAHGLTCAAGEVATVVTSSAWNALQIVVLDSSAPIFYTVDGSTPSESNPQAFIIPGGVIATEERELPARTKASFTPPSVTLKLTSAAAVKFSVQRVIPVS